MNLNDEEFDFSEMSDEEVAESLDDAMDAFGAAIGIETPWRILKEEYNSRPHAVIPNVSKIDQGKKLFQAVKKLATMYYPGSEVTAKGEPNTLMFVVNIRTYGFCVKSHQYKEFADVLQLCDAFEVTPVNDVTIDVTFYLDDFYIQN